MSIISVSPSLSVPCSMLFFFFSSIVLHPPTCSSSPPYFASTPISPLSCHCPPLFPSLSSEREREKKEGSWWTKPRNKKVIGSRYKGKFLRRSLNGNSDFSTDFISRFFKTNNDFCQIIGHRYRPIIAKTYLIE